MNATTYRLQIKLEAPPPAMPARADRSEMIGALTGALAIISTERSPIGRVYRDGLKRRIKSILDREMGTSR